MREFLAFCLMLAALFGLLAVLLTGPVKDLVKLRGDRDEIHKAAGVVETQ